MVSELDLELPKVIAQAQLGDPGAFGELYAKYAGTTIKIDGKELLILKESDGLAIVE